MDVIHVQVMNVQNAKPKQQIYCVTKAYAQIVAMVALHVLENAVQSVEIREWIYYAIEVSVNTVAMDVTHAQAGCVPVVN